MRIQHQHRQFYLCYCFVHSLKKNNRWILLGLFLDRDAYNYKCVVMVC
ncbi:hypothetical protein Hanom_Chr09g00861851 [Helianthus anomalus]